jgi:hypothetical protein
MKIWTKQVKGALLFVLITAAVSVVHGQSCRWDGTAPFCSGQCTGNEKEMTRASDPPSDPTGPPFGKRCETGTKALCCASKITSCRWDGTAPFCEGKCNSNETQTAPPAGASSGKECWTGSKVYCCGPVSSTGNSSVNPTVSQPLVGRDCSAGLDTCIQGFIWRQVIPADHVCVAPQVRQQIQADNAQAALRRSPTSTRSATISCLSGFVFREAVPGDQVCVTPAARAQAVQDNNAARTRDACPPLVPRNCSSGPGTCSQGFVWRQAIAADHVCVTPQVHQQTQADNAQAGARRGISKTKGSLSPTCLPGFVFREAFPGDQVCVTPQTRAQVAQDNSTADERNACP